MVTLHAVFADILERPAPVGLDPIRRALVADGKKLVPPVPAGGMPLVTPLAKDGSTSIGLLHWPTPVPGIEVPVVRDHGASLELLAGSIRDWVRGRMARWESEGRLDQEAAEAIDPDEECYSPGELAMSGLPLPAFAVLHGGGPPWAYEFLRRRHVDKGDLLAGGITADRLCDRFPGWGEFHARRYAMLRDRRAHQEAKDAATAAMSLPMWTLRAGFPELAAAIGWTAPFDGSPYRRQAADEERPPLDRAAYAMDAVAVEGRPWPSITDELVDRFTEGGLLGVARLVGRVTT